MIPYQSPNPQRDRDRRANAEITRAQLRIQGAKLRASVRHWYRWLRGESLRNDSNGGPPHS
jgi:hypothetical protein